MQTATSDRSHLVCARGTHQASRATCYCKVPPTARSVGSQSLSRDAADSQICTEYLPLRHVRASRPNFSLVMLTAAGQQTPHAEEPTPTCCFLRCRSDFRLKLASPRTHHPPGGGFTSLSGDPYISTRQVDGMTLPLPTHDWKAGLWLDVLVN